MQLSADGKASASSKISELVLPDPKAEDVPSAFEPEIDTRSVAELHQLGCDLLSNLLYLQNALQRAEVDFDTNGTIGLVGRAADVLRSYEPTSSPDESAVSPNDTSLVNPEALDPSMDSTKTGQESVATETSMETTLLDTRSAAKEDPGEPVERDSEDHDPAIIGIESDEMDIDGKAHLPTASNFSKKNQSEVEVHLGQNFEERREEESLDESQDEIARPENEPVCIEDSKIPSLEEVGTVSADTILDLRQDKGPQSAILASSDEASTTEEFDEDVLTNDITAGPVDVLSESIEVKLVVQQNNFTEDQTYSIPEEEGSGLAHVFTMCSSASVSDPAAALVEELVFLDGTLTNFGTVEDQVKLGQIMEVDAELGEPSELEITHSQVQSESGELCSVSEEDGSVLSHAFIASGYTDMSVLIERSGPGILRGASSDAKEGGKSPGDGPSGAITTYDSPAKEGTNPGDRAVIVSDQRLTQYFAPEEKGSSLSHVFPRSTDSQFTEGPLAKGHGNAMIDGTLTHFGNAADGRQTSPVELASTSCEIPHGIEEHHITKAFSSNFDTPYAQDTFVPSTVQEESHHAASTGSVHSRTVSAASKNDVTVSTPSTSPTSSEFSSEVEKPAPSTISYEAEKPETAVTDMPASVDTEPAKSKTAKRNAQRRRAKARKQAEIKKAEKVRENGTLSQPVSAV